MSYLIEKFKGQYKLSCPIDTSTNDFPRKLNGTYEDSDIYIDCMHGNRIYYYGKGILEAYIPSIARGHNIIKQIYSKNINPNNSQMTVKDNRVSYDILDKKVFEEDLKQSNIIFNIEETDEEVLFHFPYKNSEFIIPLLKPKTSAASRSPFSIKNLPKLEYVIPESEMREYRNIIEPIVSDGKFLILSKLTQNYINKMQKMKAYRGIDIKAVMKKKMLKGKEFIHSENLWSDYLNYIESEVETWENTQS